MLGNKPLTKSKTSVHLITVNNTGYNVEPKLAMESKSRIIYNIRNTPKNTFIYNYIKKLSFRFEYHIVWDFIIVELYHYSRPTDIFIMIQAAADHK